MASRGPTRQNLQKECQVPPVENSRPLQMYFNGGRQLLVQGDAYYNEGENETAYVLYKRFLVLAVEGIPQHNAFSNPRYQKDRAWLEKERGQVFQRLESVSQKLDAADERYAQWAAAPAVTAAATPTAPTSTGSQAFETPGSTGRNWWDNLPVAPSHDVSVPYATPSFVATTSHPIVPPMVPPHVGGAMPSAPPAQGGYSVNGYPGGVYGEGVVAAGPWPRPGPVSYVQDYNHGHGYGGISVSGPESMPVHEAFQSLSLDQGASAARQYPSMGTPEYQRERPSMRSQRSLLGLKRKMVLPSTLVAEFEKIAKRNTDRPPYGIETCGILAGKLTHNVLEMTTLIIPKQEGTSDSVATTDETELFNYMLANKLITLGWIHTHPQQDCFMSSVDVHTHCGYQLMLPEAVAVVYAPNDNKKRVGVFRLTEPEGMKLIQKCKLKGFHVHPDDVKIYDRADIEWSPVVMKIVDLR